MSWLNYDWAWSPASSWIFFLLNSTNIINILFFFYLSQIFLPHCPRFPISRFIFIMFPLKSMISLITSCLILTPLSLTIHFILSIHLWFIGFDAPPDLFALPPMPHQFSPSNHSNRLSIYPSVYFICSSILCLCFH